MNFKLYKNMRSLYIGEFFACIGFILCLYAYRNTINIDYRIIYPFVALILILLQGSYYWYYKLCIIRKRNVNRKLFKKTYQILKVVDLIILILYPIGLIYMFRVTDIDMLRKENFIGVFIFIFGIIEYINYFYIRLSYSKYNDIVDLLKFKNIRKSSLYKELEK